MPAILSAIMLSAPVLAATAPAGSASALNAAQHSPEHELGTATEPTDRCMTLEHQFDKAIKTHAKAANAVTAKDMRSEGGTLCASGKEVEGARKLQQALKELGKTPNG
jgi:hypothetical protein